MVLIIKKFILLFLNFKTIILLDNSVEKKVKKLSDLSPKLLEKMIQSDTRISKDKYNERKGEKVFLIMLFIKFTISIKV